MRNKRAIDLYSGIGGWSLGLRLAGFDVVSSYELWGVANETNFKNNKHVTQTIDIRRLQYEDLPKNIDIIVGSPPCTQFSYSNRGGSGDIQDGLEDIKKFLELVDKVKPKFWAMENVPRVAKVISKELQPSGALEDYSHIDMQIDVFNMSEFGVPQKRKRAIIGNFDFSLLSSYKTATPAVTLKDVINALASTPVKDPVFGITMKPNNLFDHDMESPLNEEEHRINFANKTLHHVYNSMSFPENLDAPARTVTATCTRVSRESLIVPVAKSTGKFRRLSVRERASLQSFPISFQLYGNSHSQKLKMIGNAMPPFFAYQIGLAFNQKKSFERPDTNLLKKLLVLPDPLPKKTTPDSAGRTYPENRSFRFAIPSLRLKSGVRFEIANKDAKKSLDWNVAFYFGTSKDIQSSYLKESYERMVLANFDGLTQDNLIFELNQLRDYCQNIDFQNLQKIWSHKGPGLTHPFSVLDKLDYFGSSFRKIFENYQTVSQQLVRKIFYDAGNPVGFKKLEKNSDLVLAGILIGHVFNNIATSKLKNNRYSVERFTNS